MNRLETSRAYSKSLEKLANQPGWALTFIPCRQTNTECQRFGSKGLQPAQKRLKAPATLRYGSARSRPRQAPNDLLILPPAEKSRSLSDKVEELCESSLHTFPDLKRRANSSLQFIQAADLGKEPPNLTQESRTRDSNRRHGCLGAPEKPSLWRCQLLAQCR